MLDNHQQFHIITQSQHVKTVRREGGRFNVDSFAQPRPKMMFVADCALHLEPSGLPKALAAPRYQKLRYQKPLGSRGRAYTQLVD